jgi:hypothetical protein
MAIRICISRSLQAPSVKNAEAEAAWWAKTGIAPAVAARTLWLDTRPFSGIPDRLPADDTAEQLASPHPEN